MQIYELSPDVNTHQYLRTDELNPNQQLEILSHFRGQPITLEEWKPFHVYLHKRDGRRLRLPSDYPCFGTLPVFSRKAVDALRIYLEENGQLLPLCSDDDEFFAYNTTRLVNGLDQNQSEVRRTEDGHITSVVKAVFQHELDPRLTIFKLKTFQQNLQPYITDNFMKLAEENGLKGFRTKLLWSSQSEG